MRVEYRYTMPYDRQVVWSHLLNQEILAASLPGCKKLNKIGEGQYEAELGLNIGPVKGRFEGVVELRDLLEPESYRLILRGKGMPGEVEANAFIRLNLLGDKTEVTCEAEAHSTGVLAAVGQRVMGGVARLMLTQFFKGVDKHTRQMLEQTEMKEGEEWNPQK